MKRGKNLGRVALGILILSAVPYRIKVDKAAHTVEVRSLLWGFQKTPGEDKNHYAFAIPASGLEYGKAKQP
ncbi:MAG: hypothetical protein IJM11_01485 [Firmicutes bacterium]|nr:hypothetical protein [Bacillota bacterium]